MAKTLTDPRRPAAGGRGQVQRRVVACGTDRPRRHGGRVSGNQALFRMLAQVGIQLDRADALDAAGKLKGEKRRLGTAIHGLTRFRGRVESSREDPRLDQAVADRLATEATSALAPTIDFNNPVGGSYDVLIASY